MNLSVERSIIESLPYGVVLIDKDLKIIGSNSKAELVFGELTGKFLYENDSKISKPEIIARVEEVIQSGLECSLIFTDGLKNHKSSLKNLDISPVIEKGKIEGALLLVHFANGQNQLQKDFNLLFESTPAYISIVDRDLNIVRANQKFRDIFGSNHSIFYTEPGKRKLENGHSPTHLAFESGQEHTDTHLVNTVNGGKIHLIATSVPYSQKDGVVNLVMEILLDITELNKLQEQLHNVHDFYTDLIDRAADGIIAIDNKGKVQLFNSTLKDILHWQISRKPSINKIQELLPVQFFGKADESGTIVKKINCIANSSNGVKIPVRLNAFEIRNKKKTIGRVAFIQDLRNIKELEQQKINAERDALLTAVNNLEQSIIDIKNERSSILNDFQKIVCSDYSLEIRIDSWNKMMIHFDYVSNVIENYIKVVQGLDKQKSLFNLKDFTESVLNEYIPVADYYNVSIRYEILVKPELTEYNEFIYRTIISTLLMNSIDSARKIPLGGRVTIRMEDNPEKIIILVSDNGPSLENQIEKFKLRIGLMTIYLIAEKNNLKFEIMYNKKQGNIYRFEFKKD
jgi:PAS domain S-box-containing protein